MGISSISTLITANTIIQLMSKVNEVIGVLIAEPAANTYVNTQLATKAANTYVVSQLATKAANSYVNIQLGTKADNTYVVTQLGTKANLTTTNVALGTKAANSYVNTQLGTKAANTYVNSQVSTINTALGTKAANSYVNSQLGTKVNASDVNDGSIDFNINLPMNTLADGATINWNMANGKIAKVTIGGARTMATPSNLKNGSCILHVYQDASGNRTISWSSAFRWPGGVAPVLSTGANQHDIFSFVCDGTFLYGTYINNV